MNRVLTSFTRAEKSIIAFVLALIGVGYGILDYQERKREVTVFQIQPDAPAELAPAVPLPKGLSDSGLIDVNSADKAVLETLPGVGPSMADRIIQHCSTNGPLQSMSDLDAIPGVGPSMMTKLAPLVTFGATGVPIQTQPVPGMPSEPAMVTPAPASPNALPVTARAPSAPIPVQSLVAQHAAYAPPAVDGPVNINRAGPEELDKLNGIGPALALRIIQDRQRVGPFRSPQDLMRVKGIGPVIMRKKRRQNRGSIKKAGRLVVCPL